MTNGRTPTPDELIHMLDEQLAGDAEMLVRLAEQAADVHSAYRDLVVRLRREIEASSAWIPGARHLRG